VRLDRDAKTVLVGNSLIADAQMVDSKTVYVIGRMFGQTNIVALDSTGSEVLNTRVTVGVSNTSVVTLYRGAQGQRTLACSPRCERTMTQGDAEFQPVATDADKKTEISDKNNKISTGK